MKKLLMLSFVVVFSVQVLAGSLEPPAAPAPTMKTLDEVEPRILIPASATPTGLFTISQSGSYYLVGDRNCSGRGIQVDVDDVTIDLCGYALIGPDLGTNDGIYMNGRKDVEIRNGIVRDFYRGIHGDSSASSGHRVIDVRVMSNLNYGIRLLGTSQTPVNGRNLEGAGNH